MIDRPPTGSVDRELPTRRHRLATAWFPTRVGGQVLAIRWSCGEFSVREATSSSERRAPVWRRRRCSNGTGSRSSSPVATSATTATSRSSTAPTCLSRARACPGTTRSSPGANGAGLERGRARRRLPPEPDSRRHRHEREDDHDRVARRDVPGRRPRRRRRRQRRPRAQRVEAPRPTRGSSASCRASSSRTSTTSALASPCSLNLEPDHLDRHGTFEAYRDAKLRIFENQRRTTLRSSRGASAWCRAGGASSSRPATRCRRSRASRRTQPRERGSGDHRRACGRRRRGGDRRGAAHVPGRPAPPRARRRAGRRSLRERLEGDEHRRRPARARLV